MISIFRTRISITDTSNKVLKSCFKKYDVLSSIYQLYFLKNKPTRKRIVYRIYSKNSKTIMYCLQCSCFNCNFFLSNYAKAGMILKS